MTKHALRNKLIAALDICKDEIMSSAYPEDEIMSHVDTCIPIYYTDLLDLARSDHETFCFVDDIGLL
jgi:hypothetical protein